MEAEKTERGGLPRVPVNSYALSYHEREERFPEAGRRCRKNRMAKASAARKAETEGRLRDGRMATPKSMGQVTWYPESAGGGTPAISRSPQNSGGPCEFPSDFP